MYCREHDLRMTGELDSSLEVSTMEFDNNQGTLQGSLKLDQDKLQLLQAQVKVHRVP